MSGIEALSKMKRKKENGLWEKDHTEDFIFMERYKYKADWEHFLLLLT